MTPLNVKILHQDYVLTCPNGKEAQLQEAIERVDTEFEAIRESAKLRSRERIGIVLSVNLAFENLELRAQLQTLQAQLAKRSQDSHEEDTGPSIDASAHQQTLDELHALQGAQTHVQSVCAALLERIDTALATTAASPEAEPYDTAPAQAEAVVEMADAAAPELLPTMVDAPVEDTPAAIANASTLTPQEAGAYYEDAPTEVDTDKDLLADETDMDFVANHEQTL